MEVHLLARMQLGAVGVAADEGGGARRRVLRQAHVHLAQVELREAVVEEEVAKVKEPEVALQVIEGAVNPVAPVHSSFAGGCCTQISKLQSLDVPKLGVV